MSSSLIFLGGSDLFEANDTKLYDIKPMGTSNDNVWRLYSVTCRVLGNTDIYVKAEKDAPRSIDATFQFSCEEPNFVYIYPAEYPDRALDMPLDCLGCM